MEENELDGVKEHLLLSPLDLWLLSPALGDSILMTSNSDGIDGRLRLILHAFLDFGTMDLETKKYHVINQPELYTSTLRGKNPTEFRVSDNYEWKKIAFFSSTVLMVDDIRPPNEY